MNYDFSENEFAFIADAQQRVQNAAAAANLESGDSRDNVCGVLEKLAETPYLSIALAETPADIGLVSLMGAMEGIGAAAPSVLLALEWSQRVFGRLIAGYAGETVKEAVLPALCRGEMIGTVALSEGALNIENEPLQTEGRKEGDQVILNGGKQYVVNAPIADRIAVAGMMDGQTAFFLVKKGTPGMAVEDRMSLIGYDGAAISGLRLENCAIPAADIVGPFDKEPVLARVRMWENQVLIGAALGLMKAAYEAARDYAKTHQSGGKPVIAYQEVGFKLAEMLTMFQTSQLLAYRMAWMTETTPKEAESLTLCTKVLATESAEKVSAAALQIMAGAGYQTGNPAEHAFRCAKFLQIAGTSTEISRVKIGDEAMGFK